MQQIWDLKKQTKKFNQQWINSTFHTNRNQWIKRQIEKKLTREQAQRDKEMQIMAKDRIRNVEGMADNPT